MNILLIGDSSRLYMPYLKNYEELLDSIQYNNYTLLNWDRFNIDDDNECRYFDDKIGHKRGLIDYYKFSKFIKRKLSKNQYDRIIVFGIPILFFIGSFLIEKYKGKYIIDIRDYHKILKIAKMKNVIVNSSHVVISSPEYKQWLPSDVHYLVNHNMNIDSFHNLSLESIKNKSNLNISFIGATRDLEININLINSLSRSEYFDIYYHGEGDINLLLEDYVRKNNIKNVFLTGRYQKIDENSLYYKSDLINVLRYNDSINNKTALPNRLYNAAYYGKPMLAYKGTYLSKIIEKYNLGLVINTFDNIELAILNFLDKFNYDNYMNGRTEFLNMAIEDNKKFKIAIGKFLV